jgi:hypothetical protein
MYRQAFPKCEIRGSFKPVPFSHLGLESSVPKKCRKCKYFFEGSCTRAMQQVSDYLFLDYGPCKIEGNTSPEPIKKYRTTDFG